MTDFHLLVLGTSIAWGQGLRDEDKIHAVLGRMLQKRLGDRKVRTIFLAHSGSSTGYTRAGNVDTHYEPRIAGEVPTAYPTILQQAEEFDQAKIDPTAIDLIILDAGINDVRVSKIIDPFTRPRTIEQLVEIYCHQHMILLLDQLTNKFKNATIVLIGYYPMLTAQSEQGYIHTLLKAFGKVPVGWLADLVISLFQRPLRQRILKNCDTFAKTSLSAFQHAAKQINKQLSAERVLVVRSVITAKHTAVTSDSWLFAINDDLSPQDSLAAIRATDCHEAPRKRTDQLTCEKASAGHPNPKGAKAYAEAIFALLEDKI